MKQCAWHQGIEQFMFWSMRTTLSLDPDVAALLERVRRQRQALALALSEGSPSNDASMG